MSEYSFSDSKHFKRPISPKERRICEIKNKFHKKKTSTDWKEFHIKILDLYFFSNQIKNIALFASGLLLYTSLEMYRYLTSWGGANTEQRDFFLLNSLLKEPLTKNETLKNMEAAVFNENKPSEKQFSATMTSTKKPESKKNNTEFKNHDVPTENADCTFDFFTDQEKIDFIKQAIINKAKTINREKFQYVWDLVSQSNDQLLNFALLCIESPLYECQKAVQNAWSILLKRDSKSACKLAKRCIKIHHDPYFGNHEVFKTAFQKLLDADILSQTSFALKFVIYQVSQKEERTVETLNHALKLFLKKKEYISILTLIKFIVENETFRKKNILAEIDLKYLFNVFINFSQPPESKFKESALDFAKILLKTENIDLIQYVTEEISKLDEKQTIRLLEEAVKFPETSICHKIVEPIASYLLDNEKSDLLLKLAIACTKTTIHQEIVNRIFARFLDKNKMYHTLELAKTCVNPDRYRLHACMEIIKNAVKCFLIIGSFQSALDFYHHCKSQTQDKSEKKFKKYTEEIKKIVRDQKINLDEFNLERSLVSLTGSKTNFLPIDQ